MKIEKKFLFHFSNASNFPSSPLPNQLRAAIWGEKMDTGYDIVFVVDEGLQLFPGETAEITVSIYTSDLNRLNDNLKRENKFIFGFPNKILGEGTLII